MYLNINAFLLLFYVNLIFAENRTLTSAVYYESLCPDSRNFFINQLADNYITNRLIDKVNLKLIPFGKAILNQATNEYNCQFDANWETNGVHCRANTLHLCIVDLHFDGQSDASKLKAMQLINCSFTPTYWRTHYAQAIEECYRQLYDSTAEPIYYCYDTKKRQLLDAAARVTALLNPALDYVPWITFRYLKDERQKSFETQFSDSVSNVLPGTIKESCKSQEKAGLKDET